MEAATVTGRTPGVATACLLAVSDTSGNGAAADSDDRHAAARMGRPPPRRGLKVTLAGVPAGRSRASLRSPGPRLSRQRVLDAPRGARRGLSCGGGRDVVAGRKVRVPDHGGASLRSSLTHAERDLQRLVHPRFSTRICARSPRALSPRGEAWSLLSSTPPSSISFCARYRAERLIQAPRSTVPQHCLRTRSSTLAHAR